MDCVTEAPWLPGSLGDIFTVAHIQIFRVQIIKLCDILNDLIAAIRLILDICCRPFGIDEARDQHALLRNVPKRTISGCVIKSEGR